MKQEDSPIEDFYQGYVECADIKIDLPMEDFLWRTRFHEKIVEKRENMQKCCKQLSNPSPRGFSGRMSPNELTPRNPGEDTTNPPIWLSGLLDSMIQIENKFDKNMVEVEKIKNKASKKNEDEDTLTVKDHEKYSLIDADDKKEEES
jgi:hypothetical protein